MSNKEDKIKYWPQLLYNGFKTNQYALTWALIRIALGLGWLDAGFHKLTGKGWIDGGSSLKTFWEHAIAVTAGGKSVVAFDWYSNFLAFMLQHDWYTWFAPLIAVSETVIGALLIVGAFTGIAAAIAGFMNWNFIMAGVASVNPVFLPIAALIVIGYKPAGYFGLDRLLLARIGTPWQLFENNPPMQILAWCIYTVIVLGIGVTAVDLFFSSTVINAILPLNIFAGTMVSTVLGWALGLLALRQTYMWRSRNRGAVIA